MQTKADNMRRSSPCGSEGFMRTVLPALLVAAAVTCVASTQAQPEQSAAAVAAALQKKYDTVADFSADFIQEAESGVLQQEARRARLPAGQEAGPDAAGPTRSPEHKIFVSDGTADVHAHAGRQPGHRQPGPRRRPGDNGGALSRPARASSPATSRSASTRAGTLTRTPCGSSPSFRSGTTTGCSWWSTDRASSSVP